MIARLRAIARIRAIARLSGGERTPERRVVVLVRVLLLVEATLYSAITPLLPHYERVLHGSKPAIGVLAAAYPAGLIPGSLLSGWLAVRTGVRWTTIVGLLVFAASVAASGFAGNLITLDGLRFISGVASGGIWGGGLTWVIAISPRERRGEVLGDAIGAAIFGTLIGPALGTLAVAVGTGPVFCAVALASLALVAWTRTYEEPPRGEQEDSAPLRSLLSSGRIALGFWLILLEACTIGAASTLLALRLARFGATEVEIGLTFLLSSLLSMFVAPAIGRTTDRHGAGRPLTLGLGVTCLLMAALTLPRTVLPLAILTVIALGPPMTTYTIPAMSVITSAAERAGIAMAGATMVLNLAWAVGETAGSPAATGVAQATSDAVPLLGLAAIMALSLVAVLRARLARPAQPAGSAQAPADRERMAA